MTSRTCGSPRTNQAAWLPERPPAQLGVHTLHAPWNSSRSTGRRNIHCPLGGARDAQGETGSQRTAFRNLSTQMTDGKVV